MPDPKHRIEEPARAWEAHEAWLKRREAELSHEGGNGTPHPPETDRELTEINRQLDQQADPVMVAVWERVDINVDPPKAGYTAKVPAALTVGELRGLAVYWMLVRDGYDDPSASEFPRALNRRRAIFDGMTGQYKAVVANWPEDEPFRLAYAHDIADEFVESGESVSAESVKKAYERVCQRQRHRDKHSISLADIADAETVDLVGDNLKAAAVVYAHEKLDAAGLFDAVDTILEDADFGRIDVGHKAIERIEDYRSLVEDTRFPSAARLEALRSRMLGQPFPTLWRGLVTAVHEYVGRQTQFDLVGSRISARIAQEPVRVAALSLATHVSEAGWGTTSSTAGRLRRQVLEARRVLRVNSITRAYGARDFLGVIERAADVQIGEVTHQLALTEAGTTVLSFLANNSERLQEDDDVLLDDTVIGGGGSGDPIENPDTADFAAACEQLYQLLGCAHQPGATEGDDETGSDEEADDEDENVFSGHGSYRQPGVFTLKPSMLAGGGEQ